MSNIQSESSLASNIFNFKQTNNSFGKENIIAEEDNEEIAFEQSGFVENDSQLHIGGSV